MEALQEAIPDYAKDIRLNLSSALTKEGSPGLSEKQIAAAALASAYAAKSEPAAKSLYAHASEFLNESEINGVRSAAIIMAMNNVYYRFTHLVEDKDYASMPARLRMTVIASPGMDKLDFELASLAVSAINGCGACMEAHTRQAVKAGVTKEGVQSVVRIAAIVTAAAQAITIAGFAKG